MKQSSVRPTDDIETILNRYGDMLYRLCIVMLKNESDAEDVIQETIIKFYQKAPTFENCEHEKAWLIRVATNKCRDLLRFRGRNLPMEEAHLPMVADESPNSGILEALADLPEKYRLVLTLYYIEEYRIEDVAKIIRRTASAVKMRLHKGRKLLEKVYLEEYL